jgi:hypothetical protein
MRRGAGARTTTDELRNGRWAACRLPAARAASQAVAFAGVTVLLS